MTDTARIPDKPALEGLESVWGGAWEREGTYRFDRSSATREQIYSIDTPPPTASGSLHVGHVFSFTHTDLMARYQRMRGKHVFYPMGWDDNGLPTERRVQNYYGVRCDPTLPYDPGFTPPFEGADGKSVKAADQIPISRRNFIELCERLTAEDEQHFEATFRMLGLSVDWTQSYRTIADEALFTSQLAFIRNVERGEAYQALAPTLWDVTFRTAVAQAELEDREQPGALSPRGFPSPRRRRHRDRDQPARAASRRAWHSSRTPTTSDTSRCSAPPSPRRVFGVEVPVVAHHLAQKDKGTGIAMICTFGDVTDVVWWRELDLPNRAIVGLRRPHHRRGPRGDHDGGRPSRLRRARRQDRLLGQAGRRGAAARLGRPARRPQGHHAPREVLREGRPAARDRLDAPVVHPQRRARRAAA